MSDIEVNGTVFRCGKLPTRAQWHVVRRLMPVLQGLMPIFAMAQAGEGVPDLGQVNVFDALAALSNTIGMLNDADADYILDSALACVTWRTGNHWQPIRAPGGAFLNGAADEFDVQLRLLWEVLKESLANFSFETVFPSQTSNGRDQTAQTAAVPRPTA